MSQAKQPDDDTVPTINTDLTKFQDAILLVLDRGEDYGLGIKRALEDAMGVSEVNHGRLYPNLDDLADMGLIEKGQWDNRTNSYRLTDAGRREVERLRNWVTADV